MIINIPDNWLPTSENINALPEPLRKLIHDLHTNCDPAGTVRMVALLEDSLASAMRMIAESDAVMGRVEGLLERWDRLGETHGARAFTGNDHKLFANELRVAVGDGDE